MSFGDFSKPLRPPPAPQLWDRSSGRRIARVYDVLRKPARSRRRDRRPPDRRAALVRLRARYPVASRYRRLAVGSAALVVGLAVVLAAVTSRQRPRFEENRDVYTALVVALEEACSEGACHFGVGIEPGNENLPRVRSLMNRLRLYAASYDAEVAEASLAGRLWKDLLVYIDPDPTPQQRHVRSLREAFDERYPAWQPPLEPLGGGWYRVSGGR